MYAFKFRVKLLSIEYSIFLLFANNEASGFAALFDIYALTVEDRMYPESLLSSHHCP